MNGNQVKCPDCGMIMIVHPNPGLADADEYVCPHCGQTKIVGWPSPLDLFGNSRTTK